MWTENLLYMPKKIEPMSVLQKRIIESDIRTEKLQKKVAGNVLKNFQESI